MFNLIVVFMEEEKKDIVIPPKKKKDDWDEELQRLYNKGKFSYKPWIYGW